MVLGRISRSRFTDAITIYSRLAFEIFLSSLHKVFFRGLQAVRSTKEFR